MLSLFISLHRMELLFSTRKSSPDKRAPLTRELTSTRRTLMRTAHSAERRLRHEAVLCRAIDKRRGLADRMDEALAPHGLAEGDGLLARGREGLHEEPLDESGRAKEACAVGDDAAPWLLGT